MLFDRLLDPVREPAELLGTALIEVPGDSRVKRLAGDLLGPLPGVENEREPAVCRVNGLEQLQPVHAGHVVVADDAVELALVERVGRGRRLGDARHRDGRQLAFEERLREVQHGRVVVDV